MSPPFGCCPLSSHCPKPSIVVSWARLLCSSFERVYLGLLTETLEQPNNQTIVVFFCWSPHEHSLLMNHPFMIIRQILRLVVYYLMPLVSVSVFYSLIAKHLFRTKGVIQSSNSSIRSLRNERNYAEPRALMVRLNSTFRSKRPATSSSAGSRKAISDAQIRKPLRARHKLAKTVLFLCLVFFICWLPKQIHDLYWYVVDTWSCSVVSHRRIPLLFSGSSVFWFIQQNGIISGRSTKRWPSFSPISIHASTLLPSISSLQHSVISTSDICFSGHRPNIHANNTQSDLEVYIVQ